MLWQRLHTGSGCESWCRWPNNVASFSVRVWLRNGWSVSDVELESLYCTIAESR